MLLLNVLGSRSKTKTKLGFQMLLILLSGLNFIHFSGGYLNFENTSNSKEWRLIKTELFHYDNKKPFIFWLILLI